MAPRPYPFLPLILALCLDLVQPLVADDAGVGTTIEAALLACALLEQGLA